MKYKLLLSAIISILYATTVQSHGLGGGSYSYKKDEKKDINQSKPTKPISERMSFSLEITDDTAKVWITNHSNQPIDTSLAEASIIISGSGHPGVVKMMPTDEGHVIGAIPTTITGTTKFDVILRIPGEWPINLVFFPARSAFPTKIIQNELPLNLNK